MRARRTWTTALAAIVTLGVAGCNGSDEPVDESATTSDDASTATSGASTPEQPTHPAGGWWCGAIGESTVDTATGGRAAEALERVSINDGTEYLCEVLLPSADDPEEYTVALELRMLSEETDRIDELRTRVQGIEGVATGPAYLGEAYIAPGLAVAIVPCGTVPGGTSPKVPWSFSLEALLPEGADLTTDLQSPLTVHLQGIDVAVGCAPSEAAEPTIGGTEVDNDDSGKVIEPTTPDGDTESSTS